jgi:hypothetical protein
MNSWKIDDRNFDSERRRERIDACEDKGALTSALNYLYGDIKAIDKSRINASLRYLTNAEKKVIKWLHTRTNGRLKKYYGANSLIAARNAKYKCQNAECGFSDVRSLELDHVNGKKSKYTAVFACLCANCHNIKSFTHDW